MWSLKIKITQVSRCFIIAFIFVIAFSAFCQTTGSIKGRIVDERTGQPLPGVNVIVKGTYYGAATDADGNFSIARMTPSDYNLEISMIGYKIHLITGIKVVSGETTEIDVGMEETILALGQEIVVVGDKPIMKVDETSSTIRFSNDDIAGKIAENVQDVIKEQIGVVESDNQIHIRGGRVDESQFIVDGLALKDPLSGDVNRLYVNPNAVEELEFISGGFNAEYGQAMSGIIDVRLKEGSNIMLYRRPFRNIGYSHQISQLRPLL